MSDNPTWWVGDEYPHWGQPPQDDQDHDEDETQPDQPSPESRAS